MHSILFIYMCWCPLKFIITITLSHISLSTSLVYLWIFFLKSSIFRVCYNKLYLYGIESSQVASGGSSLQTISPIFPSLHTSIKVRTILIRVLFIKLSNYTFLCLPCPPFPSDTPLKIIDKKLPALVMWPQKATFAFIICLNI